MRGDDRNTRGREVFYWGEFVIDEFAYRKLSTLYCFPPPFLVNSRPVGKLRHQLASPLHLQRSIFYSFRVSNLLNDTKARRVLIFSSHRSNRLFKEIFEKSKRKLKFLSKKKYFISVCKDVTVIDKTNVSLEFRFSLI